MTMDVYNKYNNKKNKFYDTISWMNKSFKEFIKNDSVETMKMMLICFTIIYVVYGWAYFINKIVKGIAPEFEHTLFGYMLLFAFGAESALYLHKKVYKLIYNDNILDIVYKNGVVIECLHELWYLAKDLWSFIDIQLHRICYTEKDDMYYKMIQYTKNKELSNKNHHGFDGINNIDD